MLEAERGFTRQEGCDGYFGRSGDSSEEVFHFYRRKQSGLEGETFAGVTSEPGGGVQLDCSRSRVCRIQEKSVQYLYYENEYKGRGTTHVRGSGSVHKSAMVHKATVRRCRHKKGTKGAHQQVLMHM